MSDREKAHTVEDVEALLLRYQIVQRSMEKNSANQTDEKYIGKQMTLELERLDLLPSSEMDSIGKLWNDCLGPSRSKMQALSAIIDPRIWELERRWVIKLDKKLINWAEITYDDIYRHQAHWWEQERNCEQDMVCFEKCEKSEASSKEILNFKWLQHSFKAHNAKHVLGALLTAQLCEGTLSPSPL